MEYIELFDFYRICDSHLHLSEVLERNLSVPQKATYSCISCCHSAEEYNRQIDFIGSANFKVYTAFGIHPQNPASENITFLESLLEENKIHGIGEAGFDFYTEQFKSKTEEQKFVFEAQLELAEKYCKPMIIHGRKCNDRFFYYAKELSRLPAVIFHSYMGTFAELESLLKKGINAYFTFGKQLLNGNKKAMECTKKIEIKRLLLETDSPYQTLKNEKNTLPSDIAKVYIQAAILRNINPENQQEMQSFTDRIYSNLEESLGIF